MSLYRVRLPDGDIWPSDASTFANAHQALALAVSKFDGVTGTRTIESERFRQAAKVAEKLGYQAVEVQIVPVSIGLPGFTTQIRGVGLAMAAVSLETVRGDLEVCAHCGMPISEEWPAFFAEAVGMLHPQCTEKARQNRESSRGTCGSGVRFDQ